MLELDHSKRSGRSETQRLAIHTVGVPSTAPPWVAGGLFSANPPAAVCGLRPALAPPLSTVIGVDLAVDLPLSAGCQQMKVMNLQA